MINAYVMVIYVGMGPRYLEATDWSRTECIGPWLNLSAWDIALQRIILVAGVQENVMELRYLFFVSSRLLAGGRPAPDNLLSASILEVLYL